MTRYLDLINSLLICALFLFNIQQGRTENHLALWSFLYPLSVFFISGCWFGLVTSILFFMLSLPLLLLPASVMGTPAYPLPFAIRYIIIFVLMTGFSFSTEYIRAKYLRRSQKENRRLEKQSNDLSLALGEISDMQRTMSNDLRLATNVQKRLLPSSPPVSDSWDIAWAYLPMAGISGDFFDFYHDRNRLGGMGIFDVSGHGVSSGLITTIAKSIVTRHFLEDRGSSLSYAMQKINEEFFQELHHVGHYLTGILVSFDNNSLRYVNAAHPSPLLLREGQAVSLHDTFTQIPYGTILGAFESGAVYQEIPFETHKDDVLVFYTDGYTDSTNPDDEPYGTDRALEALQSAGAGTSRAVVDHLVADLQRYRSGHSLADDLTLLVIRRKA